LAVLTAGVAMLRPRPEQDRITPANFERIQRGMTRAEVEAILGPPGDFQTRESFVYIHPMSKRSPPHIWEDWITDTCGITVVFDPEAGLVDEIGILQLHPMEQPLFEALLSPFRRVWRRWFP
jgi:hypothetical protein